MFLGGRLDLILGVLNGHIKYFPLRRKLGKVSEVRIINLAESMYGLRSPH